MKKKEKAEKADKPEKKGGKKKNLLFFLIALVVTAAVASAVIFLVLPRFGIQLLGGKEEEEVKPGLEAYTVGENTVAALDTVLEEDGELIANRGPGEKKTLEDEHAGVTFGERYTYLYEMTSYAPAVNRYLDILLGDGGFSLADENYLVQEERPELQDAEGSLLLAKPAVEEGRLFQIVLGWSQASDILAVRVSTPEGELTFPEKEKEDEKPEPSDVSTQMERLRAMTPAQLGLSGGSMDEYTIFPVDGFVKVNGTDCRRFNVYEKEDTGSIAATYLCSVDQQHIYVLNPATNSVSTIV